RDRVILSVEFSDGCGRLLQARAQAEDTLFGDETFGGSGLAPDPSIPSGPISGRVRGALEPDNVVVSGWQVYDNKGRVVEAYEPFFARGWEYEAAIDAQLGQKVTKVYDARGMLVRTINPDLSEQTVIFGTPADLANLMSHAPNPWETFSYDANDNAGRT